MEKYNPNKIEKKWQKIWEQKKVHQAANFSEKSKYYCLDMFPYPSGEGLHVGHWRGYVFSDVWSRYQKMLGKNVLHPMGFDAFGLPTENAAIASGVHPQIHTQKAISKMKRQLKDIGAMYDWSREIITSDPSYYKWTQWLFLQLYKAGLAYRAEAYVNFCPSCQTVLANEQVIAGRCERCDSVVEKKKLKQWFFKITKYAQRLLDDLDKIDWPQQVKIMQKNWIGRSEGVLIKFQIPLTSEASVLRRQNSKFQIEVFTTRPDTLFGATFMVLAPEHPLISKMTTVKQVKLVQNYIKNALKISEIERTKIEREKTGVFTGTYAVNPVNNRKMPIWVSDYVLSSYGTGAVMAVPAHDQRDFEFARKYHLPVVQVISKDGKEHTLERAYEEPGIMINSDNFTGLDSEKGKKEIIRYLEKKKAGKSAINYKLRDWLISRQRYWGAPIPIIYCPKCGQVPILEKDLPVLLPKNVKYLPKGKSPLASSKEFVNTKCPKCQGPAKRETDTMDTFVCSSWYFLRFTDPKNNQRFANSNKLKYWLPVDFYVGGIEHATMHLLYARFFTKALYDLKLLNFQEPFLKLYNIGMIYLHGAKMSKSKGNVVSPDEIVKKYGTDTLRGYELFVGPANQDSEWNVQGVKGVYRFLQKVYNLVLDSKEKKQTKEVLRQTHLLIKRYTDDLLRLNFNTLISHLMSFANFLLQNKSQITIFQIKTLLLLLAPIAPHFAEELWQKIGQKHSIFEQKWPKYDEKLVLEEEITVIIQINGKVRDKIVVEQKTSRKEIEKRSLESDKTKKYITGKKIQKTIYIPSKLINFVVK